MASKLRGSTRGRNRGGSRRSGGGRRGSSGRRGNTGRRGGGSRRAAARREANRRADRNRDRARSGRTKTESREATGGTSTGRESGIAAANKYVRNKDTKSLEQSVGSLDRRIANALKKGDTNLAKDLRSRQNKFAKRLATKRAHKAMINAAPLNLRDKVRKRIKANPNMMNTLGFDVFQETMDQDFLDPTRKLQNKYPEQFREMYPIGSRLQMGLPTVQAIKGMFGVKDKPIPYNLPDMPGVRYPLDKEFGAGEGEPFFGGRSRDPDFDSYPYNAPVEPVKITNLDFDPNPQFDNTDLVLPNQFPIIDPNQRTEESNKMSDIIDSGVQDFSALDKEFQKESAEYEKRKAEEPTITDKLPFEVASNEPLPSYFNLFGQNDVDTIIPEQLSPSNTEAFNTEAANLQNVLMGSGYNLSPEVITNLYQQGFLDPNTNYFANNNTNPLVDEAVASYYNTLQ